MLFFSAFPREYLQEKLEQTFSHHCALKAHSKSKQTRLALFESLVAVDCECCVCGVDGQIPRALSGTVKWVLKGDLYFGVSYHMIKVQHDTQS